jgi:glycosyltransferase involved in cell wall biosynthesis
MYYYVDHTSRFERNTGIQRCVRAIAAALTSAGVPLRPVVWNREQLDFSAAGSEALQHLACWSGPSVGAWAKSAQHHPTDAWLLIVELVSGPYQPTALQLRRAAQRRGWRVAWVFHDAIPLRWAHLYGAGAQVTAECHRAYMAGLATADLVLANSHTSAAQLRAFLAVEGLPLEHVQALPLAQEFPGVPRSEPVTRATDSAQQRLLCVGSLEPRKNHVGLLKAVAHLVAQDRFAAELVLVGWPNDPRIVACVQRALSLGLPLRWEAEADDDRLLELYHWADLTVVPSLEEGFGLSVAESLWHGRPCVCSGEGALGELAVAGGCLVLQDTSWLSVCWALQKWLLDPDLRRHLRAQVAQRPLISWASYSNELLATLANHMLHSSLSQASTPL